MARGGAIALLLAGMVAGAAIGHAMMPALFASVPTDLSRLGVIRSALRSSDPPPQLVVFGSSILMSGIDARRLAEGVDGVDRAMNLASTGQSLTEAFLLEQDLPEGCDFVVLMLSAKELATDVTIEGSKLNALVMYGFEADPDTVSILGDVFGAPMQDALATPAALQRFRARWVVRDFLDSGLRRLLRRDLDLERATTDLDRPSPYTEHVAPHKTDRLIDVWIASWPQPTYAVRDDKRALLDHTIDRARAKGARPVLLVPPLRPEVLAGLPDGYLAPFDAFLAELERDVLVVDARDLLPDTQFFDHIHPDDEGARRLSDLVARRLREAR